MWSPTPQMTTTVTMLPNQRRQPASSQLMAGAIKALVIFACCFACSFGLVYGAITALKTAATVRPAQIVQAAP